MDTVDKIEKRLDYLWQQAIEQSQTAKSDDVKKQWQAKALAYQVACAVCRNCKDPNWKYEED